MRNNEQTLGDRMKQYENIEKKYLIGKIPAMIRIDGKAFHSFTKGFKRPFDDEIFLEAMRQTMLYLCNNIQGCVFGYQQSDEISLVLQDYKRINTCAWFGYGVQKMASISASMATRVFNSTFYNLVIKNHKDYKYLTKAQSGAEFDSRVWSLPKDEVCNYFIWRQQDCVRNSINSLAQANFSHKELQGLNNNQMQDKLMIDKGINWNDLDVHLKRGTGCIKAINNKSSNEAIRQKFILDKNIPIFTKDREYINKLIYFKEDDCNEQER